MIKIKDPKEFSSILKEFKTGKEKILSNCFLMPDEISSLIDKGKLFVYQGKEWLIILCDREDYYNFFYYTSESSSTNEVKDFIKTVQDKEIFADIVTRSGRGDMITPEKLVSDGIAENYKKYQRMQLKLAEFEPSQLTVNVAEGYHLSLDYCDYENLSALWQESLDEKSTPLPNGTELKQLQNEGHLYTILDSNNELAGVIILTVTGKQGLAQHLAVSPKHRRKGLAAALMTNTILSSKKEDLSVLRLWVDCKNSSAIALYDRLNYTLDGMLCEQLYMKGF